MAFALVGYPVVAPNSFRHDPLDQPPHPLLAQMLRLVAASQHQAQVATFMATMTNKNQVRYFNHLYMNGSVDRDIMEAAERQAATIMKEAAKNATTSIDPYMSFGYVDDYDDEQNNKNNDDDCDYDDDDDDDDYPEMMTDPTQIEKYGYIPYLNYYYHYNISDIQYYYEDEQDCVSDADRAVRHQADEHEAVCSSSSYYSPSFIEDDYVSQSQHHYHFRRYSRDRIPAFSLNEEEEQKSRYIYYNDDGCGGDTWSSEMPKSKKYAELVAKSSDNVTRQQRVRIWNQCDMYDEHVIDIQKDINDGSYSRYSVSNGSNQNSINDDNTVVLTFYDEFPELPKRENRKRPSIAKRKPSINYASVVKRNVTVTKTHPPKVDDMIFSDKLHYGYDNNKQHQEIEPLCYERVPHTASRHFTKSTTAINSTTDLFINHYNQQQKAFTDGNNNNSMQLQHKVINAPTSTQTSSNQETINQNIVNYAAIVKRNTPKYTEITKRKATSPPDNTPSKKHQKQDTIVSEEAADVPSTSRVDHQEQLLLSSLLSTAVTNGHIGMEFSPATTNIKRHEDVPNDVAAGSGLAKTDESAPQSIPSPQLSSERDIRRVPEYDGNFEKQYGDGDGSNDDENDPGAAKHAASNSIVTPYAEIARRNAASKHPSFLGSGALTHIRPKTLASYDRLEQQLVKPAPIPWFETGDPLMQLYRNERKQASEYGSKMNKYFKLSQRCYHEKDWENAKYYSDEGHYYRQRMHEFHTRASHRIFQQRNQQDALFIDLHGMHVDEAKANIVSWFQKELKHYRGIVYIVTGTGHHSRPTAAAATGSRSNNNNNNKKESKLRPAVRDFVNSLYRCEETSVLGDDKGGVFAVYLCPHLYMPNMSICVYCKFTPSPPTI